MSAGAFAARQRAAEGRWFNAEERVTLLRRLERLVELGKVDRSVLEAAHLADAPAKVITERAHAVFNYVPGRVPPPRPMPSYGLGTSFSLGRGRWSSGDVSIFSVADGKRLASAPAPAGTVHEGLRAAKIQRAALETPLVAGFRLLPELTPGRALLWGTVLAMWGTAALTATAARQLDIRHSSEVSPKLRAAFAPAVAALSGWLEPLKHGMSVAAAAGTAREDAEQSVLVRRLREQLMHQRA